MNNLMQNSSSGVKPLTKPSWYKVPILVFMNLILAVTVITGFALLTVAYRTQDQVVLESGEIPLNKKQAMPQKDKTSTEDSEQQSSEIL